MGTAKSKVLVQVLLVITGIATTPCNGGALETERDRTIARTIDTVRERFGPHALRRGGAG